MAKSTASAILASIIEVCEIKDQKDGEGRQEFLMRCVKSVNDLADKDWDDLSAEAQAWFNQAADAAEANKKSGKDGALPDFPDLPKAEEKPSGRRASKEDDGGAVKVGRFVTVVTKRGKRVEGEVVELGKDLLVLKDKQGEEVEFDMERVETVEVRNDGAKPDAEESPRGLRPGDLVEFTTKRGKEVRGELVELTDDTVVVKGPDGDDDYPLSRIEGDVRAAVVAEATAARTRAKGEEKPKAGEGTKEPRTVNKGGVSVGQACKEILAKDPDLTFEGVKKALKARDIDFKDVTVEMNHTDLTRFIKCLRDEKKLK